MEIIKTNFTPNSGFLDLLTYFSKNSKYKDEISDAGVIHFISKYSLSQEVKGNADLWLEAIDIARLAKQAQIDNKEFAQSVALVLKKIPNKGEEIANLYLDFNDVKIKPKKIIKETLTK